MAPADEKSLGDGGPARWLLPFLEARYTRVVAKQKLAPAERERLDRAASQREQQALNRLLAQGRDGPVATAEFASRLQPGRGEEVLAKLPPTYWRDVIEQYRARQADVRKKAGHQSRRRIDFVHGVPPSPGILGRSNWIPIGPSVVRRGQPTGRPAISGRATGIAIAQGGLRVYVATADGGVWRSDQGGVNWYSTMENFDLDPTASAATSLACGAIAIDPDNPDRVYVGTGEGETNALFAFRLSQALPSYRGVGPLRSDNGGAMWSTEPTAAGSPTLVGAAFYQLAVDPGNAEHVVAATNVGLYRREPDGSGGQRWTQKRSGIHSSVVVARVGSTTTFFAAAWGDKVYVSNDGSNWNAAGTGFPAGCARIALTVQRTNPNVLYALVSDTARQLLGLYRLDNAGGTWKSVSGAPADLCGLGNLAQGDYDLTVAIAPGDAGTVFIGGSATGNDDASIYRGKVTPSGGAYSMTTTWVGSGAHADVHVLAYAPGDASTVWVCCDGGVFKTTDANATSTFVSCNTGLATLSATYLAQHPTEAAVAFCGLQDNGTARYTGEECWTHVTGGDGGYCVINWHDPYKVLTYADGRVFSATDGGADYGSWTEVTPPAAGWLIMDEPLVTTPPNAASPADAEIVAFGVATTLYISTDFGSTWPVTVTLGGSIYSLIFASGTRLYAGTTGGWVYRVDQSGGTWSATRIDNAAGGALSLSSLVSDIALDPSDATGQSIFVALGGSGDYRHLWHYNGSAWQARSGPSAGAATSLLDVEHNAIVVDSATSRLYVGADIGVWTSDLSGTSWTVLEAGLPDAAVLDLQIHQSSRRLRAALHGRGVYEYKLDPPAPHDVELYVRDTTLDVGLSATVNGLNDPATFPVDQTRHWESPNIKIDVPTSAGWQTPTTQIDFYVFNDKLVDGSQGVATLDSTSGTVTNRVYVEVHNRGIMAAPSVQVMLLLTDASAGLQPLPPGYTASVARGTPISTSAWQTVDVKTISNLRVGVPQVVEFDLPSTLLPPPASLPGDSHWCTLVILHSANDPFVTTETDVDTLTVTDRKVAQKNLQLVRFVGTSPGGVGPRWVRVLVHSGVKDEAPHDLELDLRHFPGRVELVAPIELLSDAAVKNFRLGDPQMVKRWSIEQRKELARLAAQRRFSPQRCTQMVHEIERVAGRPPVVLDGRRRQVVGLQLDKGETAALFLRIEPPPNVRRGTRFELTVALRTHSGRRLAGGSTYRVAVV